VNPQSYRVPQRRSCAWPKMDLAEPEAVESEKTPAGRLVISGWVTSRGQEGHERCRGGGSCAREQRPVLSSLLHTHTGEGGLTMVLNTGVWSGSHTAPTHQLLG
jgi:hypothetical protein